MGHAAQLAQEAEFFDRWAEQRAKDLEPLDPAVLERYRRPGKLYPKEYSFRLLGDLRDKTILDVGCGEGEDGMILAKLGARVTGLDVSPAAIELARQRAEQDAAEDPLPGPGPHRGHAGRAAAGEVRSRSAGDADPRLGETALLFPGPPDPIRDSRVALRARSCLATAARGPHQLFRPGRPQPALLEELGGIGILSGRKPD